MRDIDIHFRQIEPNKFWLLYNGDSFEVYVYNDGKFHNKLYECSKEIPEELEWFVDKIIEKEIKQQGYIGAYKRWTLKNDELPNAYEEVEILMNNGDVHKRHDYSRQIRKFGMAKLGRCRNKSMERNIK